MKKSPVLFLFFAVLLLPYASSAQQSPVAAARASNPAVICRDSLNTNNVSLSGAYTEGTDKTYSMPMSEWNLVASAATLRHFKKVSFATHASFTEAMAYDARGTVFLVPTQYPIDFYEKILGTKDRRKYTLNASVGGNLSDEWRLGAGIDFLGHTLSKDVPQSFSYAITFAVRPGVEWHNNDGLSVGISAIWEGCWERVNNPISGSTPEYYKVFAYEALGYGHDEVWSQGKVNAWGTQSTCLAVDTWNCGVAVRVSGRAICGEVGYKHGEGYFGEPDAKLAIFPSNSFFAHLDGGWCSKGNWKHDLALDFSLKSTDFRRPYGVYNNTFYVETRPHYAFCTPSQWRVVFDFRYSRQDDIATLLPPRTSTQLLRSAAVTTRIQHSFGRLKAELRIAGGSGFHSLNDALKGLVGSDIYFDGALYAGYVWYVTRPWYGGGLSLSYRWKNGIGINAATDFSLSGATERPGYLSPEIEVPSTIAKFKHRTTSSLGISYSF